jgi:hypothetical protein
MNNGKYVKGRSNIFGDELLEVVELNLDDGTKYVG